MGSKIQIRRGLKADLPTLDVGEVGYCIDTKELFIGTVTGNELLTFDQTQAEYAKAQGDRAKAETDRLVGLDVSILDNRMTAAETGLADMAIYARNFKNPNDTDWGLIINRAISSVSKGKVILPAGDLTINTSIVQKSNIIIEGQGIDITNLKPVGVHGITVELNQYLRFSGIKDLTIIGDNNGDNSVYDPTKNGINWNTGNVESYQCFIERVRVVRCSGKGVYVPYDFNNNYDQVFVSTCGGNGIEIAGLNTSTLRNCYVDYVPTGKAGYRVYQNAILISCNGTGGGTSDYWGVFGRNNGQFEDSNNGQSQYNVTFIGCNIEDWKKSGLKFLFAGSFNLKDGTTIYAPTTAFDYFIEVDNPSKPCFIDGTVILQSKGGVSPYSSRIKTNVTNPNFITFCQNVLNFTTDGTNVITIPKFSSVYDGSRSALEIDYMNIKGMSYFYLGGKRHDYGTTAPTTGTFNTGDIRYNTNPTSGSYAGWECMTGGTPGTWRGFGQLGAMRGVTSSRPTTSNLSGGYLYFDTTLAPNGKPIWWDTLNWVDATGTVV
jgi:hypothetical protein